MPKDSDLKSKTIRGLIWTLADFFSSQGIRFFVQLMLARLLLPEHFGLIGMIIIVIAISQSITDSGMQNALIREPNSTQTDYSTVFYFNLAVSLFLYGIIFSIAPFISRFYDEPLITNLLRFLAVMIIINSFSIVQRTILTKRLDFKGQTIINIISTSISGIFAIYLALNGYGVWSLVIQNVANQFIQAILLTQYNKWIPSLVFSGKSFKRLFGFGWKLLLSGLIDTTYRNVNNVIIGRLYTTGTLGFYTQAVMLRDVASQSITSAVQKVTYPVLSQMQEDEMRLKNGYRTIIKNSVFINFPLMIGLAVIAESLIPLLLGQVWKGSVPYFQVLCLAGMLYPLHAINLNVLQVKGRSDLFLKLEIMKKTIGIGLISVIVILHMDIMAFVWNMLLLSVISFFINSFYTKLIIGYSTINQLKDISLILIASITMGASVYMVEPYLVINEVAKVIIQIILGLIIYLGVAKLFKLPELTRISDLLIKRVKKEFNLNH